MNTKTPSILTDPVEMARAVWEYWVTALKTDSVEGSDDFPDWDEIEDDQRETFVEAIRSQVVKQFIEYRDAVDFESSLDEAFDAAKPTPPMYTDDHVRKATALCYICARVGVSSPGKSCSACYFSHVNPTLMRRPKNA